MLLLQRPTGGVCILSEATLDEMTVSRLPPWCNSSLRKTSARNDQLLDWCLQVNGGTKSEGSHGTRQIGPARPPSSFRALILAGFLPICSVKKKTPPGDPWRPDRRPERERTCPRRSASKGTIREESSQLGNRGGLSGRFCSECFVVDPSLPPCNAAFFLLRSHMF